MNLSLDSPLDFKNSINLLMEISYQGFSVQRVEPSGVLGGWFRQRLPALLHRQDLL